MSRIRSVHPALFTDEAWVSCSPLARILVIGLWTDADDQGVFEWKPLQIKMRLLPGDAANCAELLEEIQRAGMIMGYEIDGKHYGAIRNFRKFQRPQKPNALHPLPDFAAAYVGLSPTDPKPVRDQYATGTVEAQPMEDGGGKGKGESQTVVEAEQSAAPRGATVRGSPKTTSDKPKAKPAWETDPDFCAIWDASTPEMRRRSENREKTYAHYRRQAQLADGGHVIRQAHAAYLRSDPDVKRTGGPGLHIWLKDGAWEHWLDDGGGSAGAGVNVAQIDAERARIRALYETEDNAA